MKICLVGGAVRDQLLGLTVTDHDWVVVGASAEQMQQLGYQSVGKDFPVFLHPQTKEEYALARTERKQGRGYHGFVCDANPAVSLEQDLQRRDLTINAMAICGGQLIDPYGGQNDLRAKRLRHVSDAFIEDPLRVLRVARFAAKLSGLGFTLACETRDLMKHMVEIGELDHLTPERVWVETAKALQTEHPEVYFDVLREIGALARLMPEIDILFKVPQDPVHHPEGDAGRHTLMVLQAMRQKTKDSRLLWSALCHDLGKGVTPPALWPNHPGHEQAGVALVEQLSMRYRVPAHTSQLAKLVCRWHGDIHKSKELTIEQRLEVMDGCDVWRKPEQFHALLTVCEADSRGRQGFENSDYPQAKEWSIWLEKALQVSAQPFIEQGLSGLAIKLAMRQERLHRLTVASSV
ncbi:MAG: multifunctional CCA addition/repair protein [Gammaproteobacteria bacterium]|nr:multifunctional CCA addition/repair protein [Gammaproteobacteria bacterium]